jgi:hypothetical protein
VDINNYTREIEKALDNNNTLHAKDLTLKYLDIMRAVDEGRIDDVTRLRKEFNDAVTTEVRTTKGGEGQVEAVSVEKAKHRQEDVMEGLTRTSTRASCWWTTRASRSWMPTATFSTPAATRLRRLTTLGPSR